MGVLAVALASLLSCEDDSSTEARQEALEACEEVEERIDSLFRARDVRHKRIGAGRSLLNLDHRVV